MSIACEQQQATPASPRNGASGRRLIAIAWLLIAVELRRDLARFRFTDCELRVLDVLIRYSFERGSMKAAIARSVLMEQARLSDAAQLSRVLRSLREAGVLRVTENVNRATRARCQKGDCPTFEILLESKGWFKTNGSDRDRKRLEWTRPEEADLIHDGLCEANPVQVDLPPMGLPEAYELVVQECERDRLAEAGMARVTAGIAREGKLAECEEAGAARASGGPDGRESGAAPNRSQDGVVEVVNTTDAARKGAERGAVDFKTTARVGGVDLKSSALPAKQLTINQLPGEGLENAALGEAVDVKSTAQARVSSKDFKALDEDPDFKALRALSSEEARARFWEEVEEFLSGPDGLEETLHAIGDAETFKKYGDWWRLAYMVSPKEARAALNELKLRKSSPLGLPKNPGGWMKWHYSETFGGRWVGKKSATAAQRAKLELFGWRFDQTSNQKRAGM